MLTKRLYSRPKVDDFAGLELEKSVYIYQIILFTPLLNFV